MNFNKPLTPETKETKDNQREKYYKDILKTAEQRESVSESLLRDLGINNARDFVKKACLAAKNANLPIEELKDNETITLKILQLQDKVLGFKFEDNKDGCDAKLGPITFNALLEKFPVLKEHVEKRQAKLKDQKDQRKDLAADAGLPGAPSAPKPSEDKKKGSEAPKEAIQGGKFIEQWNFIKTINDPNQLLGMRDSAELKPNDPIVRIPDESNIKLREGAALRYGLFKQYAKLKGYKIDLSYGYRSIAQQTVIWERTLRANGGDVKKAWKWAAPPGRSHHNTGGAIDLIVHGPDGKKVDMHRYRGSKAAFDRAVETGDMGGIAANDRIAVETKRFMDNELKASYFLGENYHAENWHWNIDGKKVYKNV